MKINRRERIALSVFLLALLALCVDQFLLSDQPQTAAAASAVGSAPQRRSTPAVLPEIVVAPRADAPSGLDSVPDVCDWRRIAPIVAPAAAASVAAEAAAVVTAVAEFTGRHKLGGVVLGPRPAAIVSGRVIRVGQSLEGVPLIEVRRDSAVFLADGQRVELRLERPQAP
ncbi:MAG: hypothetical protein HRU75_06750 [Planctomycetia bacterium]|nr:MAG: hypothetical protein HRU75_06750 [Planctomycetia bacterium]